MNVSFFSCTYGTSNGIGIGTDEFFDSSCSCFLGILAAFVAVESLSVLYLPFFSLLGREGREERREGVEHIRWKPPPFFFSFLFLVCWEGGAERGFLHTYRHRTDMRAFVLYLPNYYVTNYLSFCALQFRETFDDYGVFLEGMCDWVVE
jgi:hypothetical protein